MASKTQVLNCTNEIDIHQRQDGSKRQKIESKTLRELPSIKAARYNTFSNWSCPNALLSHMTEAGFSYCNIADRVICMYCRLICEGWNTHIDNPYDVHRQYSPNCVFMKCLIQNDIFKSDYIASTFPFHKSFIDPKRRSASFPNSCAIRLSYRNQLVDTGFFYSSDKVICFYCDGSFDISKSNKHPVVEHIVYYPNCNYVKQLCGDQLYKEIQAALQALTKENQDDGKISTTCPTINVMDDTTRAMHVEARMDLSISRNLIESQVFSSETVKNCWNEQLKLKNADFKSGEDLYIACHIWDCQRNSEKSGCKIVILNDEKTQIKTTKHSAFVESEDILRDTSKRLKQYHQSRICLATSFVENEDFIIQRETLLSTYSSENLSRLDILKGGWSLSETKDSFICLHCKMQCCDMNIDDNPYDIHRHLSPNCLFVLAKNPLNEKSIPVRDIAIQFTNGQIRNFPSQFYQGLARRNDGFYSEVYKRKRTFDMLNAKIQDQADELSSSGLYYDDNLRLIRCFYCPSRTSIIDDGNLSPFEILQTFRHTIKCNYYWQLKDKDSYKSTKISSNKCVWCGIGENRIVALPCRHLCLCVPCSEVKRLCPICNKKVEAYSIIYT